MKLIKILNTFILYILLNFIYAVSAATTRAHNHSSDIHISVQGCCLESNKILLEDVDINLTIKLSNIPHLPINITLLSEDDFKYFNVNIRNIYFPSGYQTVTLEDNSTVLMEKKKYALSKNFTISKIMKGNTKLQFGILTNETNISYDKHIKNSITINVLGALLSPPFYIIIIATFLFIFASGLGLSGYTLKRTFTNEETLKPILCGILCQFILVPLTGISIALLFKQTGYQAFSIFLVSITPGSIMAPIFTYYIGGDRALAVSLCLTSTVIGSLLYAYYMWMYFIISGLGTEMFRFSYILLLCIIAYLLLPLSLGVMIQHFKPLWASWLRKGIPLWGAITIVTSFVVALKDYAETFASNWTIYVISVILTSLSFGISALISKLFGIDTQKTRTICLNTALPNVPLAITIMQGLLTPTCAQVLQAFPLYHLFWMLIEGVIICVVIYFFFPLIENINECSDKPITTCNNQLENTSSNIIISSKYV